MNLKKVFFFLLLMKQRGNFGFVVVVICHETVWNGATEQKRQWWGSCNMLQLPGYQEGRQRLTLKSHARKRESLAAPPNAPRRAVIRV